MNATKFIKLLWVGLIALLWVSCTKNEIDNPVTNRTALSITAAATRATDTNWQQADAIGVYMLNTGTTTPAQGDVPQPGYHYINKSADGSTASFVPANAENTAYFPIGREKVDVVAYYPYNEQLTMDNGQLTVPVDVSNQSNLPAIDLMTSALATGHSSDAPQVALTFRHRLVKMVVNLNSTLGDVTALSIEGTPATATYDLMQQTIINPNPATEAITLALAGHPEGEMASTAILIPTAAGAGVKFNLTASGRPYTATLPANVALEAGKTVTVDITLTPTAIDVAATIAPWEEGAGAGAGAVYFRLPDNPETGVPTVTNFRLWKNNNEAGAASYEYADGKWNATPRPFYVEETSAADRFYARHTPAAEAADPVTGLIDIIEAGPSAMDNRGVIDLTFSHTNALLVVNLSAGKDLPAGTDLSKATVKILGATLAGSDTGEHIFAPVTLPAGETLAVVEVDGYTYTATAAADFVLAPSTRNKLNLTVSVETAGQRIIVPEVTTKPWAVGVTTDVNAVRFVLPSNPQTGVPAITAFTVYKNGGSPTTYTYQNGQWSASPAFFLMEDIQATDRFTAEATGTEDPISKLTDILRAPAATMSAEGVINLEFAHTLAMLNIRLYPGEGLLAGTDLSKAQVEYRGATTISYQGVDASFLVNPEQFETGTIIARITVGGNVYESKLTGALNLAAGTRNTLNITLKVEQEGKTIAAINAIQKPWTELTPLALEAINTVIPQHPSGEFAEVGRFDLYKNAGTADAMKVTYEKKGTGYVPVGSAPYYAEDVLSTDRFTGEATLATDNVTGFSDVIRSAAVGMTDKGIINLNFAHINSKLTVTLVQDAALAYDLSKAIVKLLGYSPTVTGTPNSFILEPTTWAAGTRLLLISFTGSHSFEVALPAGLTLGSGEEIKMEVTLNTIGVGLSTQITDWNSTATTGTAINVTIPGHSDVASLGTLELWKMNGGTAGSAVTYNWNGSKWTTTGTPFYVEDITTGDAFYARHTPATADPVTGTPDVLTAGPASAASGEVALKFAHAMSQVEFVLSPGTGFTPSVADGKVEITLLKDYTFAADNSLTTGTTSATYTLTPGQVYTVVPQAVAASAINVKLGGRTYQAAQGITLAAGNKITVTLTLLPTETGITVEGGTWNTVSGSGTVKQDILGNLTATNLSGDGELVVTSGTHTGVYTYTHATQTLASVTPLYWDNLSGTAFNFAATFTPTAAGTPEKDVLSGTATNVAYNTLIDFGKLAHSNAKLKVTLTAGTGYTAADMQATTLSVTGLTAAVYNITAGQEYIFAPKTFVATDVITVTTPLATYTLKMSDIQVGGSSLAALEGGNSYTVALTVSKSGIGIAIDVKDWTDVDGTGNVGY